MGCAAGLGQGIRPRSPGCRESGPTRPTQDWGAAGSVLLKVHLTGMPRAFRRANMLQSIDREMPVVPLKGRVADGHRGAPPCWDWSAMACSS